MDEYRHSSHSVSRLSAHIVWVTKYCYQVLKGDVQVRCRALVVQIRNAENVQILKGNVSKDQVHMQIEYPPSISVSDLVKKLKGKTSRLLQQEFPFLGKQYWGRYFWVKNTPELRENLRATAHLIHCSHENRFNVT
jgi:putative transposase